MSLLTSFLCQCMNICRHSWPYPVHVPQFDFHTVLCIGCQTCHHGCVITPCYQHRLLEEATVITGNYRRKLSSGHKVFFDRDLISDRLVIGVEWRRELHMEVSRTSGNVHNGWCLFWN